MPRRERNIHLRRRESNLYRWIGRRKNTSRPRQKRMIIIVKNFESVENPQNEKQLIYILLDKNWGQMDQELIAAINFFSNCQDVWKVNLNSNKKSQTVKVIFLFTLAHFKWLGNWPWGRSRTSLQLFQLIFNACLLMQWLICNVNFNFIFIFNTCLMCQI